MARRVEITNKFNCQESNLEDDAVLIYHSSTQDYITEISYSLILEFLPKTQQKKLKILKIDLDAEVVLNLNFDLINKARKSVLNT